MPQLYIHVSNVQVTGQGTLIAGNDEAFQAAQNSLSLSAMDRTATTNFVLARAGVQEMTVDSSFAQERAEMPLRIRFNGANNETKL